MSGRLGANRLTYSQAIILNNWLHTNKDIAKTDPYPALAERAQAALSFVITERNIEAAIARGGFERIHPERPKAAPKHDEGVTLGEIEEAVGRAVAASMRDSIGSLQRYIDTALGQYDTAINTLSKQMEQVTRKQSEALDLLKKPQPDCQSVIDGKAVARLEKLVEHVFTKLDEEISVVRLNLQEVLRRK